MITIAPSGHGPRLLKTPLPRFSGQEPEATVTQANPSAAVDSLTLNPQSLDHKKDNTPLPSPWLRVLDDMLENIPPEQETLNGIPVSDLIYWREKIRRSPYKAPIDNQGKLQELHPCPFPSDASKPWALLEREVVGSDSPDSKRFWDIINGKNSPRELLDKISKRQVKIGPKGQISFPAPTIKRPRIWWGPAGSQQSKRGQQGKNGQPDPGSDIGSHPGKKAGDKIGKGPGQGQGTGSGEGEGAEGQGDYPKELWTPPVPRSEVAKLLQSAWGLPFIEPRGKGKMNRMEEFWDQTTPNPPTPLEKNLTVRNAIRRSAAKALYAPLLPMEQRIQNGMHGDSVPIAIREIVIENNTVIGQKSLHDAIQSYENRDLKFTDLEKILTTLDKKYAAHGFHSSRAIIPPQDNASGKLTIEVNDHLKVSDIQVHSKDNVRIAAREVKTPVAKTALIYIMDVSGSVSNDMKEMARVQNYFLDTHLMHQYGLVSAKLANEKYDDKKHFGNGIVRRFLVHTDGAEETTEEEFYTTGQSGGTKISSGFDLAKKIIEKDFPTDQWNIYVFYQGDGDNYGRDDDTAFDLMNGMLKDGVNMIGYTHLAPHSQQSNSSYDGLGSSNFYHKVKKKFDKLDTVRTSVLHRPEIDEYKQSIQRLLEENGGAKK